MADPGPRLWGLLLGGRTRVRITAVALLTTLVLAVSGSWLAYRTLAEVQARTIEQSAFQQAQGIASLLTFARLPAEFQNALPYQVSTQPGRVLFSAGLRRDTGVGLTAVGADSWADTGLLAIGAGFSFQNLAVILPDETTRPGEIAHAIDTYAVLGQGQAEANGVPAGTRVRILVFTTPFGDTSVLDNARQVSALALPGALLLVGVAVWVAVGLALRPVERLRRRVEEVSSDTVGRAVTEPETHDEVQSLARTLNALLARIDAVDSRQRVFVADAAHELRSPIATLITSLEVAERYPDAADREHTMTVLLRQAHRLRSRAEDLLLLARLDGQLDPLRTTAIDLRELVEGVVGQVVGEVAVGSVDAHGPEVTIPTGGGGPVTLVGDRADLERLFANLVSNAVRHAVGAVVVDLVRTEAGSVRVSVWNDGPGIPAASREAVFQRFARLDDARAADSGGAGLGLAIARRIAERHHGTLRVTDREPGTELVFEVEGPPATS